MRTTTPRRFLAIVVISYTYPLIEKCLFLRVFLSFSRYVVTESTPDGRLYSVPQSSQRAIYPGAVISTRNTLISFIIE